MVDADHDARDVRSAYTLALADVGFVIGAKVSLALTAIERATTVAACSMRRALLQHAACAEDHLNMLRSMCHPVQQLCCVASHCKRSRE
jgi:hypothetical protein